MLNQMDSVHSSLPSAPSIAASASLSLSALPLPSLDVEQRRHLEEFVDRR
eukprot:m.148701 g.148701  ORF g.148701 m.148701 type:complete len:50 (+) comp30613_c0_seq2:87-236(+)